MSGIARISPDFNRSDEVVHADETARRWDVRLDFESPAGVRGTFEGVVTIARDHHEAGCVPHFGHHEFDVAEYQLESLASYPTSRPVRLALPNSQS